MPPPKKHMVAGHLVPNVGGSIGRRLMQKARRISVEIHGQRTLDDYGFRANNRKVMRGLLRGDSNKSLLGIGSNELRLDDEIIVRFFKPAVGGHDDEDDDEEFDDAMSMSTLGLDGADEVSRVIRFLM